MEEVCGPGPHVVEGDCSVAEELLALVTDDHHHVGPVRTGWVARVVHQGEQVQPRERHLVLVMKMVAWSTLQYDQMVIIIQFMFLELPDIQVGHLHHTELTQMQHRVSSESLRAWQSDLLRAWSTGTSSHWCWSAQTRCSGNTARTWRGART